MHKAHDTRQQPPAARWGWLLMAGCGLAIFLIVFRAGPGQDKTNQAPQTGAGHLRGTAALRGRPAGPNPKPGMIADVTPEQTVARKLAEFARSRRGYALELARRHGVHMTAEVERFFAAVESGNWSEIDAAFRIINGGDSSAGSAKTRSEEASKMWPAIVDAYGAAEQVHLWPAKELLDYGNAVLGALRPGMVYVGGTDNGRWIPELLNDTSDAEHHIVITQNGLAAADYLEYVRLQYGDRFTALSEEDSSHAFAQYIADAQRRFEHDRQFPDQPRQLLPGEDVQIVDGKTQVGGRVAVMAINELLLQSLMDKNPGLSFAMQESFPLRGTYADALPLGPLMELGARDEQNTFTQAAATETLDYWRTTSHEILANPEAAGSEATLRSYSHDTVAAANLLGAHAYAAEAEQAYRLASQLWPANPEAVAGLAGLLARSGRESEAHQVLTDFTQRFPEQLKGLQELDSSTTFLWNASTSGH